jgi:hypothetical protein
MLGFTGPVTHAYLFFRKCATIILDLKGFFSRYADQVLNHGKPSRSWLFWNAEILSSYVRKEVRFRRWSMFGFQNYLNILVESPPTASKHMQTFATMIPSLPPSYAASSLWTVKELPFFFLSFFKSIFFFFSILSFNNIILILNWSS